MAEKPIIALLGGGQLGRMFIENALRYDVRVHVLDPDPNAPCARLADRFVVGRFDDHDTVMAFAKDADVVSIEIEHVSISALDALQAAGKTVIPDPAALRIINDKGLQKQFYEEHGIPSAPFVLVKDSAELSAHKDRLPAFLKARKGGYDGKGVMALRTVEAIPTVFEGPYVLEEMADVALELAVLVARDQEGNTAVFPVVEMVFDPELNLVKHLLVPARIDPTVTEEARRLAQAVVDGLNSPGLFAVELFLTRDGKVLVNETAPRAHNSGHFSIECCPSSQFDQLLRILMGWPLGAVTMTGMGAMLNLIGEGGTGAVHVSGMDEALSIPETFVHLYGKQETRTGRKMGHVTLTGGTAEELEERINGLQKALHIVPAVEKVNSK